MNKRIVVDPPVSEARRERVERQLFAQLAAVRITDRADAVIPPPRKSRLGIGLAFASVAVAAALVLLITRGGERGGTVESPSRVVTPVGMTSQLNIPGHALVDVMSNTSVEWQVGADGSVTLKLERGAVDCDVEPRHGRGPFVVIAKDMKVIVVGTRFKVTQNPSPRVDVARGKVRVQALGGEWLIEAGQSWTPAGQVMQTAAAEPAESQPVIAEPEAEAEIEMDPMDLKKRRTKKIAQTPATDAPAPELDKQKATEPPTTRELARDAYKAAQGYEKHDPKLAVDIYRAIARGKDTAWAAVALVSMAELQIYKLKDPQAALATLEEHNRRFPQQATREDAAWFRIEALRALGKRDEARGAAANYLREFPDGAYAGRLTK